MELKECEQSYFSSLQGIQGNKIKNDILLNKDINTKISEQPPQNYSKQKTAENSNELNDSFKQIQVEMEIFSNISQKERFNHQLTSEKTKKRGRPKEKEKIYKNDKERKKGKYRKGNACYRIFTSCDKNMHYFIKLKYKGLEKLYMPNSTNNKKKSHDAMREAINKTIYDTYCETKPRRFKGDREIKEEDENKKKLLRKLKYQELNKNKKETDMFLFNCNIEDKILFKAVTRKDFLKAYLNDENRIIKNDDTYGNINIDFFGFETYSQCFNGEYSKEEKEKFKIYVLDILENKSNDKAKIE